MVEAAGNPAVNMITNIANKIYETGYIPEMMKKSTFIVIPKKAGTTECSKHRTICISSQIGKIILRVIMLRIRGKINIDDEDVQFGFKKGKWTQNAILVLRTILERRIEKQQDTFLCFVDFEKAFDTVRHEELIEMLKGKGVDGKDIRIIRNLYRDQRAAVKIEEEYSDWVEIKRGARQGCVLSPDMFTLYSQIVMDEIRDMEGIKMDGRSINNIRYADDTALIADSKEQLQQLLNKLHESCNRRGLKINAAKTETMLVSKKNEEIQMNIKLENIQIKQVKSFKYLGSIITEDGRSEQDIKTRIGIAKTSFGKLKKILTNTHMDWSLRTRFLKGFVWSTLMYGSEAWTISNTMKKRLDALEMWFLRRMLRVSWRDHVTNDEVLRRAQTNRTLLRTIRPRQ